MSAYYNERDAYAAQWLRNLIAAGHIAHGEVDERDIRDVAPDDLRKFTQAHFFAGVGVWSHALRRAGWPDDRTIWTGSCPCQPFSAAGARGGTSDERHLWPHFFHLIQECGPPVVLGEQVASNDGLGWLDLVSVDMEAAGYAFGASDLCAAGFGGAHIRQRLYFVGLADGDRDRRASGIALRPVQTEPDDEHGGPTSGLVDAHDSGPQGCRGLGEVDAQGGRETEERRGAEASVVSNACAPLLGRNLADWLFCRDGKWRPVGPGTSPLVNAAPARVGRLRAYGNALDAETAYNFCAVVKELAGA